MDRGHSPADDKNCHRIENAIPLRVHRKCESGESVLNSSRILKHFVNAVNYILLIVVQIKFIVYGSKIIENGVQTPVLVAFGAGVSVPIHWPVRQCAQNDETEPLCIFFFFSCPVC